MPIIKSAMKRVRQHDKRRARNMATKRRIKASTKETLTNLTAKDLKAAEESLKKAIAQIDKAIKKGTLHKNTAARRKSQLTRAYNAAAPQAYGTGAASKPKATKKATPKKPATQSATKKSS